jgi:predicted helicase
VLREAFKDLLKRWGRSLDLQFVAEHGILTKQITRIYVDGALLHGLRVPFGYWEAKDENDDLEREILNKFRLGYPKDNIIFTDDATAVLWQDGAEATRADMQADNDSLLRLLTRFFAHQRQEILDFNKAVKQFAADLPAILNALRDRIADKHSASHEFADALAAFLRHARDAINPAVSGDDVREMLIQHILTEDIFAKVFNDPEFHRKNNVAAELYKLEDRLFARGEKATLLRALAPYYAGIASTAALIQSHSEKQGFLKALYEDFYKAYNRKAADRLGVVYTPGEIVRFMIRSADGLCERHFGKNLIDPGVEILDPATGTGTFVVEMLEHFRGNRDKLRHKYKKELHANEVAILPYYVANLNIEATFRAITGEFAEYPNLCLVDTLDNVSPLGVYAGHQHEMFGSLSEENVERIKRQNSRKISVVIGNPPYNAWQEEYNQNNPNRPYKRVDKRVADTYVKESNAQNPSSIYDMYTRFVRWASDRVGDNDGVVAFVMGRKPFTKGAYDGFRKVIAGEFQEVRVIDLGGDVRDNPLLTGTTHNVFGIQTGVAIWFLVRRVDGKRSGIALANYPEFALAEDKLSALESQSLQSLHLTTIKPDKRFDWFNQTELDWENLIPVVDAAKRNRRSTTHITAIFEVASAGLQTKQDDWAYGRESADVIAKMRTLIATYEATRLGAPKPTGVGNIKWHRELDRRLQAGTSLVFDNSKIVESAYRAFARRYVYFDAETNSQSFRLHELFTGMTNPTIVFSDPSFRTNFSTLASNLVPEHHFLASKDSFQAVSRYRYTKSGERLDNITDWAHDKFVTHYDNKCITKDAIFQYVYAVFHDPIYCQTYALNLKREFPRIPFYVDFAKWAAWGEKLLATHICYDEIEPWPIQRIDAPSKRADGTHPKPILRSHPDQNAVVVDSDTQVTGIPDEAWEYRLGNRSAIDWVLDQHKEKPPRDPTIREKFNTYRFADNKERMISLLAKVVRVSMDTVAITQAMKALDRNSPLSSLS